MNKTDFSNGISDCADIKEEDLQAEFDLEVTTKSDMEAKNYFLQDK